MTSTGLVAVRQKLQRVSGEAGRFGAVGAVGWVVDTAVFNLCLHFLHLQTVRSGVISNAVAIGVNYLGNRYWTYRHHDKNRYAREAALFVLFSGIGMIIQNGVLAISHYGFGYTSPLDDNLAKNVVGLGLASGFRFWAYRKWVFRKQPQSVSDSYPSAPAAVLARRPRRD
ncbi:GtrA family protein [Streptomyces kanamyceticus]|uniref:GtrA family protein n=1 Tax=Streptomyces kanamyceticus TaxID=1967 RepID=UPI001CC59B24|nr:GtrA family protein [Streptomyces kanamyceticus]